MKQKQVVGVLAVTAVASSGDTIALIAPIVLTDSLMVLSGVTLDITAANAALVLGNNAVFTVNGTVNAKGTGYESYGIVMMPGTTTATINGSGVIHLKTQGALFGIMNGQKLILDGTVTFDGLRTIADGRYGD